MELEQLGLGLSKPRYEAERSFMRQWLASAPDLTLLALEVPTPDRSGTGSLCFPAGAGPVPVLSDGQRRRCRLSAALQGALEALGQGARPADPHRLGSDGPATGKRLFSAGVPGRTADLRYAVGRISVGPAFPLQPHAACRHDGRVCNPPPFPGGGSAPPGSRSDTRCVGAGHRGHNCCFTGGLPRSVRA